MSASVTGFINTWSPSFLSTRHRIELRNVRQGGNDFLAAIPQGSQAMWAGSVMNRVAQVTQGPIRWTAQAFGLLFNPLVSFPLSILSCAVKERIYEGSVTAPLKKQTKYYALGVRDYTLPRGTISLMVGDRIGHFILGHDITEQIEQSIEVEEEGKKRRYYFHRLLPHESFDSQCREVDLYGERIQVRLDRQIEPEFACYVEITANNVRKFYRIEKEVAEPVQGSIEIHLGYGFTRYLLGPEIENETPHCVKVHTEERDLYYDTGRELSHPQEGSKNFIINGQLRYFASARYVSYRSLGMSGMINMIPKLPMKVPTRLSYFTVQTLERINRHMSDVVRVSLIVSGLALASLGHYCMSAGAFVAVSYEYLDHDLGIIPRKISFFMEKWMPSISMLGLLIVGSPISQAMAGFSLLSMNPSFKLRAHQQISSWIKWIVSNGKGFFVAHLPKLRQEDRDDLLRGISVIESLPLLGECDAPLLDNKRLNKGQIDAILEGKDDDYELNPAHYTKETQPLLQLPQNADFPQLIRLWDQVGSRWLEEASFSRLMKRLCDDKRFILFLKERFPEAKRFHYEDSWDFTQEENRRMRAEKTRAHQDQIEEWVQSLAVESGLVKEQFIADWVRDQLVLFIGKLSGSRPIEGENRFLADAFENTAKIIPFLSHPEVSLVYLEDALVKLAVEGGDYCSLAMRRASLEVLEGFTEPLQIQALEQMEPQKAFEIEALSRLQKTRLRVVQQMYNAAFINIFRLREEIQDIGEDIHLYTAFVGAIKRGFYPLEKMDMEDFNFTQLMMRETFLLPARLMLEADYKCRFSEEIRLLAIDSRHLIRNRVLEYLRGWIGDNSSLSAEEKEELLNGALLNDEDHLSDSENYEKWNRLFVFVLGLIRKKAVPMS